MKYILLITLLSCSLYAAAQCSDCTSLEEALKDPSRVRHLDLSNRGLIRIPDSIRYLTGLETLDLSQNYLADASIAGAVLPQVWKLDLSGNIGLTPLTFDRTAAMFPNLLHLNASDCRLVYLGPHIGLFRQLLTLNVSDNKLQFLPEELKEIPHLSALDFHDNEVGDITYILSNCWHLRTLNAAGNPFDPDALLVSLTSAPDLVHLTYTYRPPGREGAKALAGIQLQSLELVGIEDGGLPAALARNLSISHLTLTDCRFTRAIAPVLDAMSGLYKLTLNNTPLPQNLQKVKNLGSLELENMTCPSNATLGQLDFLDELDLTGSSIPDEQAELLPALLPRTTVRTGSFSYAPEMVANTVPAIRLPEPVQQEIPGDRPLAVVVDGIAFDVPQNAFLDAGGAVYSGSVTLQVTSYDNAITNALAGAPMILADNGRQEVFASSGMLDIRATDTTGNALQANPASSIVVTMTNQRPQQPTDLYTFDTVSRQWKQAASSPFTFSADSVIAIIVDSLNRRDLASFVNFQSVPTLVALKIRDKRWDPSMLSFSFYDRKAGYTTTGDPRPCIRRHEKNEVTRLIAGYSWRIDTLITPGLAAKLQEIECGQRVSRNVKSSVKYENMPRLIQELTVVPDLPNDNYRMSFRYKDTLISLPVFLETQKTKPTQVMRQYARFQRLLDKARTKDREEADYYKDRKMSGWQQLAKAARANAIAQARTTVYAPTYVEQLRFGLTAFGLVNCDFFMREVPEQYAALSETLTDQHGASLKTPEFVRTVLPASNVYLSSSRGQIPQYATQPTILLLPISESELGVVRLETFASGEITSFRRLDIAGKSGDEVRNLINQ